MTKEDRETDILNYKTQLDGLLMHLESRIPQNAIINVLGFSQGTATASRWISLSHPKIHNLILWAGKFAYDVELNAQKSYLSDINLYFVIGDKDEFINAKRMAEYESFLSDHQIEFNTIVYEGAHKIEEKVLLSMAESFSD